MALSMSIGKAVPQESYFPASIIARQAFTVYVAGGVGGVTVYANSPTNDKAFVLGTISLTGGTGYGSFTVSSVYNHGSNRKITAVDSAGNTASVSVGVWFTGRATAFQGGAASYYVAGGCTPLTTNYVALPSYQLCGKQVVVTNTSNGNILSAPVNDVGPYFDANYCGSDEYWNNGTGPRAEQSAYRGKQRCTACSVSCNTAGDRYLINGAIIDLSPSMMSSLGGSGEITVAWRFS